MLGSSSFVGNSAPQGFGGALFLNSAGLVLLLNTSFLANAAESGGAVYVASRNGTLLVASGAWFEANAANGDYTESVELVGGGDVDVWKGNELAPCWGGWWWACSSHAIPTDRGHPSFES